MNGDEQARKELRRRAEARLETLNESASLNMSEYAISTMVHELRTHQIELEMQNHELHQTEIALTKAYEQLSDLYDFAPVGFLTISDKGIILQANLTAVGMLATVRSDLIGRHFSTFVTDSQALGNYLHNCLLSRERMLAEVMVTTHDSEFPALLTGNAVESVELNGKVIRLVITKMVGER